MINSVEKKTSQEVIAKDVKKVDSLPPALKKHYEESTQHNHELLKRLAQM
jgi:hypothetical protein